MKKASNHHRKARASYKKMMEVIESNLALADSGDFPWYIADIHDTEIERYEQFLLMFERIRGT